MKKILIFVLLVAAIGPVVPSFADPVTYIKGERRTAKVRAKKPLLRPATLYQLRSNTKLPVFYSRDYRKVSGSVFETVYSVYNPSKKVRAQIVARHDKRKRLVTVSVRDFEVQGYPLTNTEVHAYTKPFPGPFGHIGKVGAANKNSPGQMMVRFATKRADYVQVISIADAHEDSGRNLQVYILEKK